MRFSPKSELTNHPENQLVGIDFHDFMQQEQTSTNMELAEEFGVSLRTVKNMKKKIGRN